MSNFAFNDSKFQYLVSGSRDERFANSILLRNGFVLNYTSHTSVVIGESCTREVAIVGLCVDALGEIPRFSIADYLCNNVNGAFELAKKTSRFAGKYIIIFQEKNKTYVFGDASSSLGVYYHFSDGDNCFASSEHVIAKFLDLTESEISLEIQKASSVGQVLPYNITMYNDLYFLLPNHFLDITNRKSVRYFPDYRLRGNEEYDTILRRSKFLISNIVNEYSKYYDLVCPLTSGWDSRVVFSFLQENKKTECYTFNHHHFKLDSAEIRIPQEICAQADITHRLLEIKKVPAELSDRVSALTGKHVYQRAVDLAFTIKSSYGDKAIINGDIIGQIGKSSIFNSVPTICSTTSYFVTKMHCFSPAGWRATSKHVADLRKIDSKKYIFDMFAWEHRCGRWAARNSEVYSSIGVNMLNIFNNSELIMLWMDINRVKRVDHALHIDLLKSTKPFLLKYPFNPESKTDWIRNNKYVYYFASHVKFCYEMFLYYGKQVGKFF